MCDEDTTDATEVYKTDVEGEGFLGRNKIDAERTDMEEEQ